MDRTAGDDAATLGESRCPHCGAHRIRTLDVCHNCGHRFDGRPRIPVRGGPAAQEHASGRRFAEPDPVRVVLDPFDRRQLARAARARYEIGCLVFFGRLAGLVVGAMLGTALFIQPARDLLGGAIAVLLTALIASWLGGYAVLRFLARDA